jgi:bifunctional non-homologous end joining protein LigD
VEDGRHAARLKRYGAKRDFAATPEPAPPASATPEPPGAKPKRAPAGAKSGARAATGGAPRFVIHEHHATRLHWDLRLERDGALASWAVPKGLPQAPGENHLAVAVEDHPLEYLDFEAEIPKGQYGAGTIAIWDRGTYECLKWEPRKVEVALHGERVDARYALFPIDGGAQPKNWLIHRMDPPADGEREPMPARIAPMLARAGSLPQEDGGWAYEVKWDGVRAIAYSQPGELRLESRNLKDISDSYPELFGLNAALGSHTAILDGEIVALDSAGRPSFEALAQRMHTASRAKARKLAQGTPVTYAIFDLLWLDGHSLMRAPYSERRARLAKLALNGANWQTPEHIVGEGSALLEASAEQGLEGILAKRLDSAYRPGLRRPGGGEDQARQSSRARRRRLDAGQGQAQPQRRRAAARRARCRWTAALRWPRRQRLQRRRAGAVVRPAHAARACHLAVRRRREATAGGALLRATARRRGRVRELDG